MHDLSVTTVPPSVDIVIVNWNTGKYLRQCLESISKIKNIGYSLNRVVVVDNASVDGSADFLSDIDLPLRLIRNEKNRGFSVACNQGARDSEVDYLLFLNPDTRLMQTSLSPVIRFMEEKENNYIGICGVKLLNESGKASTIGARFPSLRMYVVEMFGLSKFFPRVYSSYLLTSEDLVTEGEIDVVIGAYFLVRRILFFRLDGFDERYFVYFEEVDFSYRASKVGFRSYYYPESTAYHIGRISSRKDLRNALFFSLSSRIKYGLKHFPPAKAYVLILLTMTVEFLSRIAWAIAGRSETGVIEVVDAYLNLLKSLVWSSD